MASKAHQYYDWHLIDPQMVQQGLDTQRKGLVLRQIVLPVVQNYLVDLVPLVVFQAHLLVMLLDDLSENSNRLALKECYDRFRYCLLFDLHNTLLRTISQFFRQKVQVLDQTRVCNNFDC